MLLIVGNLTLVKTMLTRFWYCTKTNFPHIWCRWSTDAIHETHLHTYKSMYTSEKSMNLQRRRKFQPIAGHTYSMIYACNNNSTILTQNIFFKYETAWRLRRKISHLRKPRDYAVLESTGSCRYFQCSYTRWLIVESICRMTPHKLQENVLLHVSVHERTY